MKLKEEKEIKKKSILRFITVFILVILAIYFYNKLGIKSYFTRENVEVFLKPFGQWIPVIYLITFIIAMIFYIPASIFLVTIGTLLGPAWGSVWGLIGCYISSIILFFMSKKINTQVIKNKLGNKWNIFNQKMEEDGFFYLSLVRSTSIFPFAVISYCSGLTSIKLTDFIKGTFIGCIPQIIVYCYIVPMVISQSFSNDKAITILLITLIWITLFLVAYSLHKKEKLKINNQVD